MRGLSERGDTLIEVTFALTILGFVLLGSTAVAAGALRTGQLAKERTEVSQVAQEQMEALRSFRDNHTWAEFRNGDGSGHGYFTGIDSVPKQACQFDASQQCFHMAVRPTSAGTQEWVPVTGAWTTAEVDGLPASSKVPTSWVEVTTTTPVTGRGCGYRFELHYGFQVQGGGVDARNQIVTELSDLEAGGCP